MLGNLAYSTLQLASIPLQRCTPEGGDEYATGSLVPCCAHLSVHNEGGKLICRGSAPQDGANADGKEQDSQDVTINLDVNTKFQSILGKMLHSVRKSVSSDLLWMF